MTLKQREDGQLFEFLQTFTKMSTTTTTTNPIQIL
jgi:hypothetical protein